MRFRGTATHCTTRSYWNIAHCHLFKWILWREKITYNMAPRVVMRRVVAVWTRLKNSLAVSTCEGFWPNATVMLNSRPTVGCAWRTSDSRYDTCTSAIMYRTGFRLQHWRLIGFLDNSLADGMYYAEFRRHWCVITPLCDWQGIMKFAWNDKHLGNGCLPSPSDYVYLFINTITSNDAKNSRTDRAIVKLKQLSAEWLHE